jgi:hypothetical protein
MPSRLSSVKLLAKGTLDQRHEPGAGGNGHIFLFFSFFFAQLVSKRTGVDNKFHLTMPKLPILACSLSFMGIEDGSTRQSSLVLGRRQCNAHPPPLGHWPR